MTIQSIDPNDSAITQSTIIDCENDGQGFSVCTAEKMPIQSFRDLTITNGGGYYEAGRFIVLRQQPDNKKLHHQR